MELYVGQWEFLCEKMLQSVDWLTSSTPIN
jgi:hypothetical protein